jgi:hypothetical protein
VLPGRGNRERRLLDWAQGDVYSLSKTDTLSRKQLSLVLPEPALLILANAAPGVTQTPSCCVGGVLQTG